MNLPDETTRRLAEEGVAAVWLFGSRAGGRPRTDSDTDVAVLLAEHVAAPGLVARGRLADVLATALGRADVDLVVLDHAPLALRARVITAGVLLVAIDDVRRVRSRWTRCRAGATCARPSAGRTAPTSTASPGKALSDDLLVHLYADVDDALLYEFLQDGLDDLDAFARAIAGLLD
jgi:predicted nucleotidyltransferase